MTLSEYKRKAVAIAQKDSAEGFKFHVWGNPFSKRIEALTGRAIADGLNMRERDEVELAWQNALKDSRPVGSFGHY